MKETKDVIACVVHHGFFGEPFAERLSRDLKHVYVFSEWEKGFSTIQDYSQGDGCDAYERCEDIWDILDEVDLFVFPDVQKSGLQLHLESLGKAVWGSRTGDKLELDREFFLSWLKKSGLKVPPHDVIVGIERLRDHLRDRVDQYIKVSLFRGSFETFHWRSWELDKIALDGWSSSNFGPAGKLVRFLVFPDIQTPLEIGADTYSVDGQFPKVMLNGVEWKDKSYFGCVTPTKEMPSQIQQILPKLSPFLKQSRYRNQWSMEVRVKGSESYFIDATCRMGLPSTASQLELWKNFSDIVWHGANGELVEPQPVGKFSAEACLKVKADHEWGTARVPKELRQWVKLTRCFELEGVTVFGQNQYLGEECGWLVAVGQTPEEVVKKLNKQADMLPDGMDANTECLSYVFKEMHQAERSGVKFSGVIPKPSVVVES